MSTPAPRPTACYHPQTFDYLDPTTPLGDKYKFYTAHKWRKVEYNDDGTNMHVILQAIKHD